MNGQLKKVTLGVKTAKNGHKLKKIQYKEDAAALRVWKNIWPDKWKQTVCDIGPLTTISMVVIKVSHHGKHYFSCSFEIKSSVYYAVALRIWHYNHNQQMIECGHGNLFFFSC